MMKDTIQVPSTTDTLLTDCLRIDQDESSAVLSRVARRVKDEISNAMELSEEDDESYRSGSISIKKLPKAREIEILSEEAGEITVTMAAFYAYILADMCNDVFEHVKESIEQAIRAKYGKDMEITVRKESTNG